MPIEFIPNQPIIFEHPIGTYGCLNNDNRAYNQLAQPEDKICVQWKLLPCEESEFCEPNMYDLGTEEFLKDWLDNGQGGWSSSSFDNINYSSPNTIFNPQISNLNNTYVAGRVYQFTFTINTITGNLPLTLSIPFSSFSNQQYTQAGTYTIYFIPRFSTLSINFYWGNPLNNVDETNYVEIINMNCFQITSCWQDAFGFSNSQLGHSSWSYNYENGQGKFCSLYSSNPNAIGDLLNDNAYTQAGNYCGVTFTITDSTQGSIMVTLGGTILGTITGNGQFALYGIPIDSSLELRFTQLGGFDGCINEVNVTDYGSSTRFLAYIVNEDNTIASNQFTPDYYEDRIVFCKNWNDLFLNIISDCPIYKVALYEECVVDAYDIYYSVNKISYNTNGWECTKVVDAWNDGYAFGFYFGNIANPVFTLYQRLRVLQFNPKYSNQVTEYLYSSGGRTRTYAESQKYRDCWFDYVDEYTHDCIRTQLLSDKLSIDGYYFFYRTEEYEPEWNSNFKYNLAQSRVELIHENAIFGSYCGTQSNAQCPPQTINTNTGELSNIRFVGIYRFDKAYNVASAPFKYYEYDMDGGASTSFTIAIYNLNNSIDRDTLKNDIIDLLETKYGGTITGNISFATTTLYYELVIDLTGTISLIGNHDTIGIASGIYSNPANTYWDSSLFMANLY
jgi:hypothetical protein